MAALDLGELLVHVLSRVAEEVKREGFDLCYSVQAYASRRGAKATVQLSVMPISQVCPECKLTVVAPFSEWRNTPGSLGVRYVCPECFEKLNKAKEESDHARKTEPGGVD
jgi:transposase-like protein